MRHPASIVLVASLALFSCDDGSTTGGDGGGKAGDGSRASERGKASDGTAPGKAKVGDPCKVDSDCAEPPDAKCFTTVGGGMAPTIIFPGGYCSRACGHEDSGTIDCGEGGGCAQLSLSGGGGGTAKFQFCGKGCKKNEDCRTAEGYTCRILFPGFPGICAPK